MTIIIFGSDGLMGRSISLLYKETILYNHENADITDFKKIKSIFETYKPSIIINCAAIVGISECNKNEIGAINTNANAVLNLANLCREYNTTFIQLSTGSVFSNKYTSNNEFDIPYPDSIYGSTKLLGEKYIINNCHKYFIIRLPFIFSGGEVKGTLNKLMDKVLEHIPIEAYDNHIYRYGYSKDMAKSIKDISDRYPYGIYHIYNNGLGSIYEFLKYFNKITKSNAKIKKIRSKKDIFCLMNNSKYIELRNWKEALKEYATI